MPLQSTDARDFIALTKADLHLHLVGSASLNAISELAAAHPEVGIPSALETLRTMYTFRNFTHFLSVHRSISELIRAPEDIVTLVVGLSVDLKEQGTPYAEVTVTPYSHLLAGVVAKDLATALEIGARRARREQGVEIAYVYDISSRDGERGARFTLDAALRHGPDELVGFGLGGPEEGVRRADFAPYFAAARAAGLHSVPHAGESSSPTEVYAALDQLGAERIGHGIASVCDERLLARLADEGIVLEVCPSSNIATGVVGSLASHPLPKLLEAGVQVVLCSDDPPMFRTTLPEEYRRVHDELGVTMADLRKLARRSIVASFATPELKSRLLKD